MSEIPVKLQGAPNFREVGKDIPNCPDLKARSLLRSSHLSALTDQDLITLKDLKISLLCDLRLDEERLTHPNRVDPRTADRTAIFKIMPGSAEGFKQQILDGRLTVESAQSAMLDVYGELAREHTHAYSELLSLAAKAPEGPVLIHCAAGKDRTGWAIALILLAVGVPLDRIFADYLESQKRFPIEKEILASQLDWKQKGAPEVDAEALRPIYSVDARYLEQALTTARLLTGSLESYIEVGLSVDPDLRNALRKRFLVAE